MSNSAIATQTVTNPPTTDLDAEKLATAGPSGQDIYRERIQVTGSELEEVAKVDNEFPVETEYGLVTRPLWSANDMRLYDLVERILLQLERIEFHLSVLSDETFKEETKLT